MASDTKGVIGKDLIEDPQTLAQYRQNGLMPRAITRDATAELDALFKMRDEAILKAEWEPLMNSEDYPVYVATDTQTGEIVTDSWDREKYGAVGGKAGPHFPRQPMTHARTYFQISDDLAIACETSSVTMGGETATWRAANLLVRRDGKWKNKAILETGFGDFLLGQGFVEPVKKPSP